MGSPGHVLISGSGGGGGNGLNCLASKRPKRANREVGFRWFNASSGSLGSSVDGGMLESDATQEPQDSAEQELALL